MENAFASTGHRVRVKGEYIIKEKMFVQLYLAI